MAETGGPFDGDQGTTASSFSQLLFSDDIVLSLDMDQSFTNCSCYSSTTFSAPEKPPRMLCFGNHQDSEVLVYGETTTATAGITPQKSGVTCSDSSSASSGNNSSANTHCKSNKKRNGSGHGQQSVQCSSSLTTTPVATQRTNKKTKADNNPSSTGHAKVRKEKLGERITALQQLVSPFGKTDTASVLHEAMGYIRFLHDQVQVLCSPYLQHRLPEGGEDENGGDEETGKDLKSRGLCLVPMACTVHVASSNGADFWSPAMGSNVSSLSLTKQQ